MSSGFDALKHLTMDTGVRFTELSGAMAKYSAAVNSFGAGDFGKVIKGASTDLSKFGFTSKESAELLGSMIQSQQGYTDAQNNLGMMYQNGQGVDQDDAEAIKWYLKAGQQGSADAQNNLAMMYQSGKGVKQDDAEAIKWYLKAAQQGCAAAQNTLGWIYQSGKGVKQDDAEAIKWYLKAAEQRSAVAQYNLGLMYSRGLQDYAEAARWFLKAAEQGIADAQFNFGLILEEGRGVLQDLESAVMWYNEAAEQGHAEAQLSMRVTLTVLLSAAWLGGCAEDQSDPPEVASIVRDCAAIATTGDMYRYCMAVGPQRALLPDNG